MGENDFSINDMPTMRPVSASGGGRRLVAGDTILGRYTVVRELGEGGMGVVYQCLDIVGGVDVAVKGLPPEVSRNEDEMDDIRANYQIVRKLRHPNIAGVATLEKDAAAGDYYLVMDLAAGTTLKRWARRHPDVGLDVKLAILRQVAAALDYAHAEKVIHRDVKPENVMVDDDGRVKVLDFGLAAQIRSSQSRTSNTVTSKGGTPGYKSPEQWLGRPQQAPADVYSFGVMAYWLFSGHLPFDGDDPVVLGHAVLSAPVEPIPDLPAHMNAALVKALAKAPDERFESCGEVVDALEGTNLSTQRREEAEAQGGRAGAPRPPQDDCGARRPAEPVGSRVPRDRGDAPEEEAKRARAETKIRMLRLKQISDDDGFAKRKSELNDAFQKADIFFESGLWADAASRFAECSRQVENLEKLDSERNTAVEMRKKAAAAQSGAKNAQAGEYAAAEWENAARLLSDGDAAYGRMDFAAAIVALGDSAAGFSKSEHKAIAERKAREEAERKAREEAERKAREVAKRKAREEAERKAREEAERKVIEEQARCGKVQLWEGGPYWATKNIGAEKPEDYGYYFWWGDTVGHKRVGDVWKTSNGSAPEFSLKNANMCSRIFSKMFGKQDTMDFQTASVPTNRKDLSALRRDGWITAAGTLAPEHDAAHVNWGGDWRMPTDRELKYLCEKCDWTWTQVNGVNGCVIRGRGKYASASIFLPCAGYGLGTSLYYAGSCGYYWSSVPISDNYYAWSLNFYSSRHGTYGNDRYYGQSVRPVQGFTK